jgi:hypothetical protein
MIVYYDIHMQDLNKVCGLHWGEEGGVFLALLQVICIITAGQQTVTHLKTEVNTNYI